MYRPIVADTSLIVDFIATCKYQLVVLLLTTNGLWIISSHCHWIQAGSTEERPGTTDGVTAGPDPAVKQVRARHGWVLYTWRVRWWSDRIATRWWCAVTTRRECHLDTIDLSRIDRKSIDPRDFWRASRAAEVFRQMTTSR